MLHTFLLHTYIQLLDFSVGKVKICNVSDQNTAINRYGTYAYMNGILIHMCTHSVHTYIRVIVSKSEAQEICEIWQQCTVYT